MLRLSRAVVADTTAFSMYFVVLFFPYIHTILYFVYMYIYILYFFIDSFIGYTLANDDSNLQSLKLTHGFVLIIMVRRMN